MTVEAGYFEGLDVGGLFELVFAVIFGLDVDAASVFELSVVFDD